MASGLSSDRQEPHSHFKPGQPVGESVPRLIVPRCEALQLLMHMPLDRSQQLPYQLSERMVDRLKGPFQNRRGAELQGAYPREVI